MSITSKFTRPLEIYKYASAMINKIITEYDYIILNKLQQFLVQ